VSDSVNKKSQGHKRKTIWKRQEERKALGIMKEGQDSFKTQRSRKIAINMR
jgi:hypothetical protein